MEPGLKSKLEKTVVDIVQMIQETKSLLKLFGKDFLGSLDMFEEKLLISGIFGESRGRMKKSVDLKRFKEMGLSKISLVLLNFIEGQYFQISRMFQEMYVRLEDLKGKCKDMMIDGLECLEILKG